LSNITLGVLYGLVGLVAGYYLFIWTEKLIKKKCLQRNIKNEDLFFNKIYIEIAFCIINAAAWAWTGLQAGKPLDLLLFAILFSLATMIAMIDLRIHTIPNELVIAILTIGICFQLIHFGGRSLLIAVACMLGIMILFMIVAAIVGFDKVGAGDVKLAGAMGLVLGYPHILSAVLVMCVAMLIFIFIGIKTYRLTRKSMFAYGPFMMIGLTVALISIGANIAKPEDFIISAFGKYYSFWHESLPYALIRNRSFLLGGK
jgi:leader peptidase (prepilin peptidase)/N-methyltransferase